MKKEGILLFIILGFVSCYDNKQTEVNQVIDVVNNAGKYQRVYCSEYFSSIELIPLETSAECLLNIVPNPSIVLNNNLIFMDGDRRLYAFDRTGKFLNQIGERGQGSSEYLLLLNYFLNTEKSIIYVEDLRKILEYDFKGKFIRSFPKPIIDETTLSNFCYVETDLFIGSARYNGKNKYKYCLFDQNGDTVKCFPNYLFYNKAGSWSTRDDQALKPVKVDKQLYLKDYVNDTIYVLENSNMQPACIFGFGKYTYPIEDLERLNIQNPAPYNYFRIISLVGTSKFFFYEIFVPAVFSRPNSKPEYNPILNEYISSDGTVYGIYNISKKTNKLLDTDEHFQKGIINDINGGLPFIPIYFAGNGEVVGVWNPDDMKEMLTDEYFAKQTIKDQQAHQKLRELLKNLKEDDNPVVVIAKLK